MGEIWTGYLRRDEGDYIVAELCCMPACDVTFCFISDVVGTC